MQNKNIYFLILILTVLLVGGAAFYYWKNPQKAPVSETEKQSERQKELSRAIEAGDLAACDKIPKKEDSEICRNTVVLTLVRLAKEKLDDSFCEKLDNEKDQTNCQKAVLYDKAERQGVEVCRQAGTEGEKRDCEKEYYFTMAIQKNDITQCVSLKNEEEREECRKDFSQWQKER